MNHVKTSIADAGWKSQTYADGCVGNICVGLYRQEMKVFIPKSVILC